MEAGTQTVGRGRIRLVLGPMFAGKSSELIRIANVAIRARRKVFLIRHKIDKRFKESDGSLLVTHGGDGLRPNEKIIPFQCECIADALAAIPDDIKIILIDEGQFFPDLVEGCLEMVKRGIDIIVAALNGTFDQKPFENVGNLIPHVENITHINAQCFECGETTCYTCLRDQPLCGAPKIAPGGAELYVALCSVCMR